LAAEQVVEEVRALDAVRADLPHLRRVLPSVL
jgi:hypothetical protein